MIIIIILLYLSCNTHTHIHGYFIIIKFSVLTCVCLCATTTFVLLILIEATIHYAKCCTQYVTSIVYGSLNKFKDNYVLICAALITSKEFITVFFLLCSLCMPGIKIMQANKLFFRDALLWIHDNEVYQAGGQSCAQQFQPCNTEKLPS